MPSRKTSEVKVDPATTPVDIDDRDTTPRNSTDARNKYERAIVAAMEARRLNDITRVTGESLSARVTQMAIENVRSGRVTFHYQDDSRPAPEATEEE
jgi:hypothetical protein